MRDNWIAVTYLCLWVLLLALPDKLLLLGMSHRQVLSRHGVTHVYNHWSGMPPLAEQHTRIQGFTAGVTGLRLLTPLGLSYAEAKKRTEPYTKIVEELPQIRREVVQLLWQAVGVGWRAYVFVNNRAEGNAPLTMEGLVVMLRESASWQ